jgi:hypothetical protein
MIITQFDLPFSLFPKRGHTYLDPERTSGLHLTDIIRSIMIDAGMLKTVSGSEWGEDSLNMAGEVGFMWEEILSSALKNRLPDRIGEILLNGVYMSPDGLDVQDWCLWEYKAVWHSVRRSPADNWKWMSQVKGYCKGLGCQDVKMAILYINGDWKGGGPQYKGYAIHFEEIEIEENWEMIVGHARGKGWI